MGSASSRLGRSRCGKQDESPPPYSAQGGQEMVRYSEKTQQPREREQPRSTGSQDAALEPAAEPAQGLDSSTPPKKSTSKRAWECMPLIDAAHDGHLEVIKVLVAGGAEIDATNTRGQTALFGAARSGHCHIVKYLHERGATLDCATVNGTPLSTAAKYGHIETVNYLIAHGATIQPALDNKGRSPLAVAAQKGHVQVVKALLDAGAGPESGPGKSPLYQASRSNYPEVVQLLLEYGGNPNSKFTVNC